MDAVKLELKQVLVLVLILAQPMAERIVLDLLLNHIQMKLVMYRLP